MVSMALVQWGVGAILGNAYYVAFLLGSEMPADFHYRNWTLGI